jgi:peptidoglycan/LPS O-acetylase OafA/YrhL
VVQADSVTPAERVQDRRPPQPGFRPDVEGLRAVAVVAVVLFHADVPGVGGGFVGVDVFFVISGFLITGMLWREASSSGTVRLRRFYGARARRLLPASATVGVVTALASVALLSPLQAPGVLYDGIASALYVGNYWFILQNISYFASLLPPSPFQHYWSLGVEEQFYLVWPVMIIATAWLIRRIRRRSNPDASSSPRPYLVVLAMVAAVSFALSLVVTYWAQFIAFFSLPTRAWELAAGGLVALAANWWRRLQQPAAAAITGWTGLALILWACTRLSATTLYPGTAALLPVMGTVLVIGAGCAAASRGCGRVLASAPMRAIGRVSYSWYLWHWPVLVLAPALLGHPLGLGGRLTAALLSGGLAVLTLRVIENPVRFAPRLRRSPWRSLGVGAAATAVAVCVAVALLGRVPIPVGHGAPATPLTVTATPLPAGSDVDAYDAAVQQAFALVQAAVSASVDLKAVPSNLNPPLAGADPDAEDYSFNGCLRMPFQGGQPECAMGDAASSTRVALVGDSHAAMWTPAFRQIATQQHWRLEMLAKGGCPLMDVKISGNIFRRLVERYQHCEQWRAQILNRLSAEHPRLIVVSMWRGYGADESLTGFTPYSPEWMDSLTHLVRRLRDTGAQVLVLGPIPGPHSVARFCLSDHLDDAKACSPLRTTAVNKSGIAGELSATQAGGGQYADLTELFCASVRCPVIVGNTLVYIDVSHLTRQYARVLTPVMGALADRALVHG